MKRHAARNNSPIRKVGPWTRQEYQTLTDRHGADWFKQTDQEILAWTDALRAEQRTVTHYHFSR